MKGFVGVDRGNGEGEGRVFGGTHSAEVQGFLLGRTRVRGGGFDVAIGGGGGVERDHFKVRVVDCVVERELLSEEVALMFDPKVDEREQDENAYENDDCEDK